MLLVTDLGANAFFAIATFDSVFDDVFFREAVVDAGENVKHHSETEKADNVLDKPTNMAGSWH